jgi:hypothetical protein
MSADRSALGCRPVGGADQIEGVFAYQHPLGVNTTFMQASISKAWAIALST